MAWCCCSPGPSCWCAARLGLSALVIGLTVVVFGTSAPELAVTVQAGLAGKADLALGNVVGSNIFNILFFAGVGAIVAPGGLDVAPALVRSDLPVMVAGALACLPIFFTVHLIARREGALFFGYYVAYTLYLLLNATGHDALPAYSVAMLEFVLPLTVVTLLVLVLRALREPSR